MQYPVLIVISIHSHKPQSLPGSVKNNLWRKRHNHLGVCFPYSYTLILHHTPCCCFFCQYLSLSIVHVNLLGTQLLHLLFSSQSGLSWILWSWAVWAWNPDCDPCVCCGVKWESAELVSCPHHTHSRRFGNMGTKCGRIWVYQWKCCTFNLNCPVSLKNLLVIWQVWKHSKSSDMIVQVKIKRLLFESL